MNEQEKQDKKVELTTLKCFIDEHQKMLAVVGVFVALSVFFTKSELSSIGLFISFLCLAVTTPLLLQIYQNFRSVKPSWLLLIFMNIFTPLMAYIFWYLLIAYRPFWKTQTSNVILWATVIPLWYLLKRLHVQNVVASWIEKLLYTINRLITICVNSVMNKRLIKQVNNLHISEEEKQQQRELVERSGESFRQSQQKSDREQAARESKVPANIIVGLTIFIGCNMIANYFGLAINQRLDKVYESYKAAEATPTLTPSPSPTVTPPTSSPTPLPISLPSPVSTITPSLEPTPTRRHRSH